MVFLKKAFLGLCLLVGIVLIWDSLPFYATADNLAREDQPLATATFAGGCFWCMEKPFDELEGVVSTTSGYTGGHVENPTYKAVSNGNTGHREAVQVVYDPSQISYDTLLEVFWRNVDPLDSRGQFCDKGSQYTAAIFPETEAQQQAAAASKQQLQSSSRFGQPIATQILPAQTFYPAEEYHQDYYLKHPVRYHFYRNACGRDQRLTELKVKYPH